MVADMDIKFAIAGLSIEPTDEQKARERENRCRLAMVGVGLHPDTGEPLSGADRGAMRGLAEKLAYEAWLGSDRQRSIAKFIFDDLRDRFIETSNPVWAWEAISIADEYGVEYPEWVREYFSGIATAIKHDTETKSESRNETDAERFGKIAGFKGSRGRTGAWQQVKNWRRDFAIYNDVEDKVQDGEKPDFAYSDVAKLHGISRATAIRAYKEMAARFSSDS
jgi:hypothetical protein